MIMIVLLGKKLILLRINSHICLTKVVIFVHVI